MTFSNALNIFLGPALIIIIMLVECLNRASNDFFLKRNISALLIITLFAIIIDFVFSMILSYAPNIRWLSKFILKDNILRLIISLLPVIFYLLIIFIFQKYKKYRFILFIVSLFVSIITGSVKLLWSVMAALLLFDYLFIVYKESKIDNLTGLNNRYSFFEYFSRLSRGKTGESWNVVMIDVINFKTINNIYGYLEGDDVLRKLAKVINKNAATSDFAARYGGDEFVLVVKADNSADEIMSGIIKELDIFNKTGGKPYSIEIIYGTDIFTADGKTEIDGFLSNLDMVVLKQNEDSRRVGDYNS